MKFYEQIGTYTGAFIRKYINAEDDEEVPPKVIQGFLILMLIFFTINLL